jgi:hypothetical protein
MVCSAYIRPKAWIWLYQWYDGHFQDITKRQWHEHFRKIYKGAKYTPIMNEQFVMDSNVLFSLIIDKDADRSNIRDVGNSDYWYYDKYLKYWHSPTSIATSGEHTTHTMRELHTWGVWPRQLGFSWSMQ